MEFSKDIEGLVDRLDNANKQLKHAKSADERLAIGNYIYGLYEALEAIICLPLEYNEKNVFGSHKNLKKFVKKTDIYNDRILQNFFDNRKYHNAMFGNIINGLGGELTFLDDQYTCMYQNMTKGEFFDIFSSFLESLNLNKEFDNFIKDIGIYSFKGDVMPDIGGFLLYNPVDKATDIFSSDAEYDIRTLTILAHEFGHAYDFSKFEGDYTDYNKYLHQSFYTEVLSILFERLLEDYLINNNILVNDVKDDLILRNETRYLTLFASYIDSVLDYDLLRKDRQDKYSSEYIYSLIEKYVNEDVKDIIDDIMTLNVRHNHIYTYGDIISMIMKENVDKYGFDNDMILEMFNRRGEIFSPEYLDNYGVTPERYIEGYQKELKLLKK